MTVALKDIWNFTAKLTPGKLTNILKAECSYQLSRILRHPVAWGVPHTYSVEPTSLCNLHCPECPTGKGEILRKNRDLNMELYRSIIEQIAPTTSYLMLYLQGEPFLSPSLFSMIRIADQHNLYTCISTNGHFLRDDNALKTVESGLDRIIIALDGATSDVYRKYRVRGNFHEVTAGIRNLVEAKRKLRSATPYIILQFIVFKHNQHQIAEIKKLGKSLGVDKVELKTAQLYNYSKGHTMLTDLIAYARYRNNGEEVTLKRNIHNRCKRIWTVGVITTDGLMTPCCFDKDASYAMGMVNASNLSRLWKSEAFRNHRLTVLTRRKSIPMCNNCTE